MESSTNDDGQSRSDFGEVAPETEEGAEVVEGFLLDAKASRMDDALIRQFEQAIHKPTALYQHRDLMRIAAEHDPIDLAQASTCLPIGARSVVYKSLPDIEAKVSFVINATSPTRVAIFRTLQDEEITALLENMPPDEAVPVLEDLPIRRVKRVLDFVEVRRARRIMALQQHRRHTAGRLMTNEFFAFTLETRVGEAVALIRDRPGVELTQSVFVLGADMDLLGYVSDRNLMVNPEDVPLKNLMRPVLHRVRPQTSRDDVVELFERYRLATLPVVDSEDRLVGVITQGDAFEMMEEMADETIAYIGGTAECLTEDVSTWKRFTSRAPWLSVTLIAGLTTAVGFSFFQGQQWFLVVPFFVPLITGMSGNVGIQCSTVLIRGMAMREISPSSLGSAIRRELRIGGLIGGCFGILCGAAAYLLNQTGFQHLCSDPVLVGTIVSCGVFGACFTAALLGTLSPLFFLRFQIDPAVASGPIVTACSDVLATYMFFFVAWLVAHLF